MEEPEATEALAVREVLEAQVVRAEPEAWEVLVEEQAVREVVGPGAPVVERAALEEVLQ